ncbi:MAG TPA: ATP-binding cassette domain-containing protein [Actinomycetota bacterium]|nr:ATP-binding cassette domain-containing protein [Actinomycetota bacterium]
MSLELRDIHKSFGPVRANDGVGLTVEAGALHGLLGENGAGKSTLMKIVSGFISADSGEVILDGQRLDLASPKDAIRAGIGMLHQDPLVFLPFTVLDNFLLGGPGGVRVDRRAGARHLRETGERFGFAFDPDAPARSLTVGERQQLEIVRLLWLGASVLILDEPTTGISATQRVKLFETLRSLAGEGMIVIFVSHKLEEVEELCDRVTVMRRGKAVGEAEMPCPTDRLVEMMFGKVLVEAESRKVQAGDVVLELDSVTLRERAITTTDLSLSVRAGEVVGLAGLEGSGQRTLLRACAGLLEPASGRVRIGGRDLTGRGYRDFLAAGMHYLPAGRLEEGLVAGLTVAEHLALTGDDRRFFIDWGEARRLAEARIKDNFIVGAPDSTADALSGGNQQRLLLAMMPPNLRLLLMEHPTRGLDIESADWVWTQLLRRRHGGTAIVFASADLDELLRYSDRILVFFAGEVLRILHARDTTGEELGHLIGGKELV